MSAASDAERASVLLEERLRPRMLAGGAEWLSDARARAAATPTQLDVVFPGVARRVGRGALLPEGSAGQRLFGDSGPRLDVWTVDQAARVLLLLDVARRSPQSAMDRAAELYFQGDARERISVLRGLSLLAPSDAGLRVVGDALRANAANLFAAAICENEYASTALSDELFYQGVLKAAFMGISLERIERVEARTTPELARMLYAYVTEREHAGRPVAADLWPLIARHPPAEVGENLRGRLAAAIGADERRLLSLALQRLEG